MYKVFIDEQAYNYLKEWSEQCKRFVLDCPAVAQKFMIVCKSSSLSDEITLYATLTKYGYKFNLSYKKELAAKGKILRTPNGENDFQIQFEIKECSSVDKVLFSVLPQLIQSYCNAFLMANAFLMYGNVIDDANIIAQGRNSGIDKIIVFRPYKEKLYAVPVGHHRSPEGVFEVRGHFRYYKKSGKIVWIDNYLKGTDNEEK